MDEQTATNQLTGIGCAALVATIILTPIAWIFIGFFSLIIPLSTCVLMALATHKLAKRVEASSDSKANVSRAAKALSDPGSPSYSYRGHQSGKATQARHSILDDAHFAPKKATTAKSDFTLNLGNPISSGESVLMFEYADANGVVTDRSVSDWTEYTHHIRGFCLSACDERTFRKDRILIWVLGENELKRPQ